MRSRYGDRHSKRKQNIVLNSLIGLVLVVILVLVANIVFSGDKPQQTAGEEQQTAQSNTNENANSNSDDAVTSDEADSKGSESTDADKENADEDSSNKDATDDEKSKEKDKEKEDKEKEKEDKEKEDQKKEEESEKNIPGEPNLEGPWEPVGTVQTGNHVSSYQIGTDDWNEKIKAAESVMGLSEDEMTIWKIGGNGGPQQSYARVSKAGSGNPVYFIELKWVDGKGWKPVSVTKE